jgi:hypothetical protein
MTKKGEHMSEDQKRKISETMKRLYPDGRPRPVFFRLWLSKEEFALLRKAAELTGENMSSLTRRLINKELARLSLFSEEKNRAILGITQKEALSGTT